MKSKLAKYMGKSNSGNPAKTAKSAKTLNLDLHGYTLSQLELAAHPDEWEEIKDNPVAIEAFALALSECEQVGSQ